MPRALLPAVSRLWSPEMELRDMSLVEGERGCGRRCSFCVMAGASPPRMVPPEDVLATVPEGARRVGLVGAAIGDHPRLAEILEELVERGLEVGLSSLRADRVAGEPRLLSLLARGGARSATIAADAASARLRRLVRKDLTGEQLLESARLAGELGFSSLKLYLMVGLPTETEEDLEELAGLARAMASHLPLTLAVSPFVPKIGTPLAGAPFAGVSTVEQRMAHLRDSLAGVARLRPTSGRWAWVESRLARGDASMGAAVVAAVEGGGRFAAWKKALAPPPGST